MKEIKKQKHWNIRFRKDEIASQEVVRNLMAELSVSETMAKLLYTRGFSKAEEVFSFFLGHAGYLQDLTENGFGYGTYTFGE